MTVIDKNHKHSIAQLPNFLKIKKKIFSSKWLISDFVPEKYGKSKFLKLILMRLWRIKNVFESFHFLVELNFREIPIKHLKLVVGVSTL